MVGQRGGGLAAKAPSRWEGLGGCGQDPGGAKHGGRHCRPGKDLLRPPFYQEPPAAVSQGTFAVRSLLSRETRLSPSPAHLDSFTWGGSRRDGRILGVVSTELPDGKGMR